MQNTEQPIRIWEIKNFASHLMKEFILVEIQLGYQKRGEKSGLSRNQKCPQWIFRGSDRY